MLLLLTLSPLGRGLGVSSRWRGVGGVRVINVTRTGTLASWLLNLLLSGTPWLWVTSPHPRSSA